MSKKLRCLNFSPKLIQILENNKINTCRVALNYSPIELMFLLKTDLETAKDILFKASQVTAPKQTTALALLHEINRNHLTTDLASFDFISNGGLSRGTINEIGGPPGCGKTQFCFLMTINQLLKDTNNYKDDGKIKTSVNVVKDKISENNKNILDENTHSNHAKNKKSVIYIDTEGAFDIERIVEMALARYPEEFEDVEGEIDKDECMIEDMAKRVILLRETNLNGLMDRLERIEEIIIKENVGLVILDSVASLFKREFNCQLKGNVFERNKLLTKMVAILKIMAHNYHLVILVTNQITTQFNSHNNDFIKNTSIKNNYHNNNTSLNINNTSYDSLINEEAMRLSVDKEEQSTNAWDESRVTVALGIQWSHCINCKLLVQYSDHENVKQLYLVKSPTSPIVKFLYTTEKSGIQIQSEPIYEEQNFNYISVKTKSGLS